MFQRILVPVDVDHESSWRKPLPVAEHMAADYGAELHVMTVVPTYGTAMVGGFFPPDFEKKALALAETRLRELVQARAAKPDAITIHIAHGTIYEQVLKAAKKLDCDVIVMSAHRPELRDYLLGPNAARVMRHARASVFVVRE